ncbi:MULTISPECIES: biotin-independent malonate decarboxylase subunit gamma [unclassified Acinetobacter]|uniref:biotin-independent malonate decarboxylase subunit gamma n=1 Tax=unclassified Acinetobacter TaxID=196816 RepID=UPI00102384FA|nr:MULTISPECIES: biotin-independent malonate decarboxylase subunit gamma [unclassified Acinetobacter]RZG76927.1 biotin-independent malonate decarboxylase subunit gamma [Acinetobacter sp. WCHAc060025]RZG87035.1 biotin-independent malonate decarboxylase subunit gamma [Acinetobacter sp. WCHAc060033]
METEMILKQLFPHDLNYDIQGHFICGSAQTAVGKVRIVGTVNSAPINQQIAMQIASEVLNIIAEDAQTPVVFIVDTQGQALSRSDELLCLNRTFAHLASCVDLLRRKQHPNLAIILGEAVSGGFLSYGLMSNQVFALEQSQVKVMDLNAMSRVTKIPVERLKELSQSSAIFAPGVENFYKMGAISAIWHTLDENLVPDAIQQQQTQIDQYLNDDRGTLAQQRQGRHLCNDIVQAVLSA